MALGGHSKLCIMAGYASVAVGQARTGQRQIFAGLAQQGQKNFRNSWPVAWPAVGLVGQANAGRAIFSSAVALAGLLAHTKSRFISEIEHLCN